MWHAWKVVLSVLLLSLMSFASVQAADPPPTAPPRAPAAYVPAPAPLYTWTGFYLGGNLGWGWNQGSFNGPAGAVVSTTNTVNFVAGAQVGYVGDTIVRGWENVFAPLQGIFSFQFFLQPAAAALLAIHAGIKDARQGPLQFLCASVTSPSYRSASIDR